MARLRYLQNARTGTAGTINKSTYPLQFYDDDMYIYASADGVLEIVSDTTLTLTAPTINLTSSTVSAFTYPISITFNCTASSVSDLTITSVSSSTSGSVVIKPLYVDATMSATGLGRAIEGKLTVTGKLGDYGNAIKGYTDLTGGTGCTGLVSAICAEMKMPATTALGTHAVLEIELVTQSGSIFQQGTGTNCTSLIRARVSGDGTAVTSFNDYGYFLDLQGLTSASADLFDGCTLKCAISSIKYYLLLSTATASFTTAYPIVSTDDNAIGITSTFVPDDNYTDYALAIGWKGNANEIEVSFASAQNENLNLIQMNVNAVATVADEGPTNASQMNLMHSLITHDTHDMDNLRLKCADFTVVVSKDINDAYAYQGEVDVTDSAVGGEAAVAGLVMSCPSGTVSGHMRGLIVAMQGAQMPSTSKGILISANVSATLDEGLCIESQNGTTITKGINFIAHATGNITAAIDCRGDGMANITNFINAPILEGCFNTTNTVGSQVGRILVNWSGTQRCIPIYALS